MKIYDYGGDAQDVELKDKEIELIMITILSGDETGEVLYVDGEERFFDACLGGRMMSYYDGSYLVPKQLVKQWLEYPDTHEDGNPDRRLGWFEKLFEDWRKENETEEQ